MIIIKKIIHILVIVLFCCFICLFFSGCDFSVKANIDDLKINVSDYESGIPELTVSKNNFQIEYYLNMRAAITWQDKTIKNHNYIVSWEFIGDDLGCQIMVIDPSCTSGRVAMVRLGDQEGKVTLRATAQSKNIITAELIIWIEAPVSTDNS